MVGLLVGPVRSPLFAAKLTTSMAATSLAYCNETAISSRSMSLSEMPAFKHLLGNQLRRPDPSVEPVVALSSREGKKLFTEALASGTMENYFPLSEQYLTQTDASITAVSSLAMVLNAINHDPKRTWKGPWRWNSEEVLQCSGACGHSLDKLRRTGVTFSELVALTRCQGVRASPLSAGISDADLEGFRRDVRAICEDSGSSSQMIVNYSRSTLKQEGIESNFSPIGGYHSKRDLVLVLDVARTPFWVPLPQLWSAMATLDALSGHTRGYATISSWVTAPVAGDAPLCPFMIRSWSEHARAHQCCKGGKHAHRRRPVPRPQRPAGSSQDATVLGTFAGKWPISAGAAGMPSSAHEPGGLTGRARPMHTSRVACP